MRMGDLLQEVSLIIKYPVNLHIGMIIINSYYLILGMSNSEFQLYSIGQINQPVNFKNTSLKGQET